MELERGLMNDGSRALGDLGRDLRGNRSYPRSHI